MNYKLYTQGHPTLSNLEYPINFEHFDKPKSIDNVVLWIKESMKAAKLVDSDVNQVTSDGASNAIGSMAEFEVQTRTNRSNDVDVGVCIAHQNQRSGQWASGLGDFANPVNPELGLILKKSHNIQEKFRRAPNRMQVYRTIQSKMNRKPMLNPKPGNDTRWDSRQDECRQANLIMGDICKALQNLLSEGGDDYVSLTAEEKSSSDLDAHVYTDHDKMVLRQFEASAMQAKYFSKFTQERGNSYAYVLMEIRLAIQNTSGDFFLMHSGMFVTVICCTNISRYISRYN